MHIEVQRNSRFNGVATCAACLLFIGDGAVTAADPITGRPSLAPINCSAAAAHLTLSPPPASPSSLLSLPPPAQLVFHNVVFRASLNLEKRLSADSAPLATRDARFPALCRFACRIHPICNCIGDSISVVSRRLNVPFPMLAERERARSFVMMRDYDASTRVEINGDRNLRDERAGPNAGSAKHPLVISVCREGGGESKNAVVGKKHSIYRSVIRANPVNRFACVACTLRIRRRQCASANLHGY